MASVFNTIYGEQTGKWMLGAEHNGLGGKWSYDGPPTVGPSIYRQNNLRAYGYHPGSEVLVVPSRASLEVDWTSLAVGALIGLLAYPFLKGLGKK